MSGPELSRKMKNTDIKLQHGTQYIQYTLVMLHIACTVTVTVYIQTEFGSYLRILVLVYTAGTFNMPTSYHYGKEGRILSGPW